MIWTPPSSTGNTAGFTWAPVYASYGSNNRTNAVRVPAKGRFEIRASDSAVNPHLAAALVLAAGLEGIEQQIDPGPSRGHDNLFESGDKEGAKLLPRNLGEAIDAFDADPLAKSVFGDSMHKAYVDFKRTEYSDYCKHVSEWEVKRYLRQFG
jgi:glutamine synthetase